MPNKLIKSFLGNIFPIIGVLFLGWSVFALLLSYWLENIAIGFYQILKMKRAMLNYPVNEQNKMIPGPLRPVKPAEKIFAMIFFCIHYGLFCAGHFFFLYFFSVIVNDQIHFTPTILLSALPFFFTHGSNYLEEYVAKKQYETTPLAKLFFSPYRRIVILQVVLILGAVPIMLAATVSARFTVLLIILKIVLDFKVSERASTIEGDIDQASKSI